MVFVGGQPVNLFFLLTLDFILETPVCFFDDPGMTLPYFWDKVAILWNIDEIYCGFMRLNGISIGFDLMELLGQLLSMEYEWTIDGIYTIWKS